jgi:NADH-quinone oxidoreductase subunit G
MNGHVTITVDGRELQVAKGTLLWEACNANGISIPIFCYHTKLGAVGACRTCMVEQIGGPPKPITACSTPVTDGMQIRTRSPIVEKAQRGIFEFLLANHPLDCPICDRAGECPLQDQTFDFGPGTSRYVEPKRHHVKPIVLGPTIALDRERCVLCWRCVRFCAEIAEDRSIVLLDRGDRTVVGTFEGEPYVSQFSGNVVELCPVGALTSRKQRFNFRPWELQNRPSICPHCSMGCNIDVSVRKNDEVVRFLSRDNPDVDNSWLCDRGRFNFAFVNDPQRLKSPLLRQPDGSFEEVSWSHALDFIASRLRPILEHEEMGPGTIGGIASARLTNEDLYVLTRFVGDVLGSPNVDHYPRPLAGLDAAGRAALERLDARVASIPDLLVAKTILIVGTDPSRREPVLELRIREAVNKHGARLAVLTSGEIPLSGKAIWNGTYDLPSFVPMVRALTTAIRRPEAGSRDDAGKLAALLSEGPVVVLYDDALDGLADKSGALEAVADLVDALGVSGMAGVIPMLEESNSMGARDLGVFPGEAACGPSIVEALGRGDSSLRALFVLGADIAREVPGTSGALQTLDLLVVTELVMTETARLADVVLPVASFAEKTGTMTNTERRLQLLQPAVPRPGVARAEWEILADLSQLFDRPLNYALPDDVWDDIARAIPKYASIAYADIGPRGTRPQAPAAATAASVGGGAT